MKGRATETAQEGDGGVCIRGKGIELPGFLDVPRDARGIVIFAHGSGSRRRSPRNRMVARSLNHKGFATLLFDLLTESEAMDRDCVFNISLLAERLKLARQWTAGDALVGNLATGLFGASTGAAVTLVVAADASTDIAAVVSRGGRADLAMPVLAGVEVPVLLIVGSRDHGVIELNRDAAGLIRHCEVVTVPGATHLFEEPGALGQVCDHAGEWFQRYLVAGSRYTSGLSSDMTDTGSRA